MKNLVMMILFVNKNIFLNIMNYLHLIIILGLLYWIYNNNTQFYSTYKLKIILKYYYLLTSLDFRANNLLSGQGIN